MPRLPPSLIALALQGTAWLAAFLIAGNLGWPPLALALLAGLLAATFSHLAKQARWWLIIQIVFAPALVLALAANIDPRIFLLAFLLLLLVYWSTFRTQVPLYLSSQKVWRSLETLLPADRPLRFIDLGSGLGGVLTHLARQRPESRFDGVEVAPIPFALSWLRIRLGGYRNCTVRWQSLWDCNLADYDVVFAYLSPVPMSALWEKVERELHPGALFISNSFAVSNHPPRETRNVDDLHRSQLHLWKK
ncbi:class I SAM-dependent methyltransferase [Ferrigenium sp. UT5]|uniref:class I SAM-dependent methyltransferase n=1 Tax=Ferrigenium sp. UT5 TaxID=3242105 RepID=UPI00354D1D2E